MIASINQLASAAQRALASPADCLWFQTMMIKSICCAQLIDLPQYSLIQDLTRTFDRRQKELIMSAHQRNTTLLDCTLHGLGLFQRQTEWLLAENMFAGVGCSYNGILMQMMRQTDVDRVDIAMSKHLVIIIEDACASSLFGSAARILLRHIAGRRNPRIFRDL